MTNWWTLEEITINAQESARLGCAPESCPFEETTGEARCWHAAYAAEKRVMARNNFPPVSVLETLGRAHRNAYPEMIGNRPVMIANPRTSLLYFLVYAVALTLIVGGVALVVLTSALTQMPWGLWFTGCATITLGALILMFSREMVLFMARDD